MSAEPVFDAIHSIEDRYSPPVGRELNDLAKLLDEGRLSGGAPVLASYERALAMWFGVPRAVAVSSGSSALHATLVALGVGPGTEVLVPATAPLPTALPILTCGATPVIVDTLPGSLAIDPASVVRRLTDRCRAAITLPLWGYPNDDQQAAAVLAEARVPVIEDACQAHGTVVGGRYAGTVGVAGCFSTHDRKLLSTGEGGFVLTNDEELGERIDVYAHLGHLDGRHHGVNYKLAAPLAAIGLRRLALLQAQLDARRHNAHRILRALPPEGLLRELGHADGDLPNYYTLVLTATRRQHDLADALASVGLPSDSIRYGYRPLYQRPLFAPYTSACPNAEALVATFQIPVHPGMPAATVEWVAARIAAIAHGGSAA